MSVDSRYSMCVPCRNHTTQRHQFVSETDLQTVVEDIASSCELNAPGVSQEAIHVLNPGRLRSRVCFSGCETFGCLEKRSPMLVAALRVRWRTGGRPARFCVSDQEDWRQFSQPVLHLAKPINGATDVEIVAPTEIQVLLGRQHTPTGGKSHDGSRGKLAAVGIGASADQSLILFTA